MARTLHDMVVIVTGASAGIGAALARELSGRGARLALAARRLQRLEELNRSLGGRHLCAETDVSDCAACERLIHQAVNHFGRIDTLVCNAGSGLLLPVAETSADQMRRLFQANVFGTLDCVRPAVRAMLKQDPRPGERWRGQVVIVSSAVARRALPWAGAYAATKAAQLSLAEALRVELKPKGIAVTSVHPVGTETEFETSAQAAAEADKPAPIRRSPGEVRQSPQRVARAIARGIERPRPEVWPFRPARWLAAVGTLVPGVVDRLLARRVVRPDAG